MGMWMMSERGALIWSVMRDTAGRIPLFRFKSGPAKKVEKRITRLKVVWILRIPFATGSNKPKIGKG
jgi:hypothetical protein